MKKPPWLNSNGTIYCKQAKPEERLWGLINVLVGRNRGTYLTGVIRAETKNMWHNAALNYMFSLVCLPAQTSLPPLLNFIHTFISRKSHEKGQQTVKIQYLCLHLHKKKCLNKKKPQQQFDISPFRFRFHGDKKKAVRSQVTQNQLFSQERKQPASFINITTMYE